MWAYCVGALGFSEDAALRRIQAARIARPMPVFLQAMEAGQLHLTAVCLLAPYANPGNVDDLIAMVAHQSKSEIERRLAERFPRTEAMTLVETFSGPPTTP